ncbi:hypothetical protein MSG28_012579 [Choristoneura fumiferana]|uniref:Uncharacterized protein n=1 Tax=Choristoneura fumiferana TaxID=7141 RepID=A0ACC0JH61_CHOFU|nr:hypothetical protein MSG28_012579 [Choristoneura fumiferana]
MSQQLIAGRVPSMCQRGVISMEKTIIDTSLCRVNGTSTRPKVWDRVLSGVVELDISCLLHQRFGTEIKWSNPQIGQTNTDFRFAHTFAKSPENSAVAMNSKKKNKNKQNKPPNPTPPQKEEVIDAVKPPEEVIESVENRVPNIVSENVAEVKQPEETPKKPKRNRGKKKKDDERSDKEDDVKVEDPVPPVPSQAVEDALSDANIAPTARKKKNKNKNNQAEHLDNKDIKGEVKLENIDTKQEVPFQKEEETETESKPSKKKNKKKKNRNDSERSEKEDVSCTSAFQQLLVEEEKAKGKNEKNTKPSKDQEIVKEVLGTPQVNVATDVAEEYLLKDEVHKNKKKNKKDKKNAPIEQSKLIDEMKTPELTKPDVKSMPSDEVESTNQLIEKENTESLKISECVPDASTAEQKSPKLKAKIAKPVEKKKKERNDTEKGKSECIDQLKVSETESLPVTNVAKREALPAVPSEKIVSPTEISPDWHEEVKIDEDNTFDVSCGNKDEINLLLRPKENAEKNRKRKKSPKPNQKNEIPTTPETTIEAPHTSKSDVIVAVADTAIMAQDLKSKHEQTHISEDKIEHAKATTEKVQPSKGKKSPKPQIKNEQASSEVFTGMPLVDTPKDVTILSREISLTKNINVNTEELPVQLPETNITEEVKKDESERIPTPVHEKSKKRKKSPKPSIDIEKASGSKEKSKNNVLNIDDIIIIQAEVVSDEKPQKSDTFIASGENISSSDDTQNAKVKPDCEKSKKGKKSPRPIKKDLFPDFKTTAELTEVKDSHGDVQIPVTPKPSDIKILPGTIPVEVELPQVEPMPSPSDITPDFVEYPRCSSEQLLDSNNNTVIQEIMNVETKLGVPIDKKNTPFIQSTDLITPELTTGESEAKISQTEPAVRITDEKTDLKSKVMEVNQDMEELRLSIERSLAELTSLDKTDPENVKKIQEDKKKNAEEAVMQITPVLPDVKQVPDLVKTEEVCGVIKEPLTEEVVIQEPVCPERKDRKGKGKSKRKGKQEVAQSSTSESATNTTTESKESNQSKNEKQEDKKSETTQEKSKQQTSSTKENKDCETSLHPEENIHTDFEPIENFEDAMTSSVDDINKTFEIIANEASPRLDKSHNNPEINVTAPQEDERGGRQEKQNPVSPPKNLLGHPDIPVSSSRTDYKKEKNKTPNYRQAKVKIKDLNDDNIEAPEKSKQSKESQTESKRKCLNQKRLDESICVTNKNEDYVYKYSFRKVFLQCACHVCKKDLTQSRVPCSYCNLVFYCSQKHKDEDYPQHQALCFAVSTICHLKDQKFIYADARNVTGHNYRLLRMQTIVSSEKVLKRRLAAWEQEALLYPRVCARAACREWKQAALKDCQGCGQNLLFYHINENVPTKIIHNDSGAHLAHITRRSEFKSRPVHLKKILDFVDQMISYCSEHPDHLPSSHGRWCKSYNLYRSLVRHQQTQGRLEPKLPTRIVELNPMPDNINEVLAAMYEERIVMVVPLDMSDIEYAALTQLATAPLTALYCLQGYRRTANGITKVYEVARNS